MNDTSYGFGTTIRGDTFDEVVRRVTEALANEGFGILTQIDVAATLKKKLGIDFRRYVILGACNPPLARRALDADPQVGLLLPCNVVVQDDGAGAIGVSIADPRAMFTLVDNPGIAPVAVEAEQRLRRVLQAMEAPAP